jgi:hypothetical protein
MPIHLALTLAALLGLAAAEAAPVAFATVAKGTDSQIEEPRQAVARTAAEWSRLWAEHAGEAPRPAVDVKGSMVVAVFVGARPSTGYLVEITRIETDGTGLAVSYRETKPKPGEMAAQMLTSPFHIVRTASRDGAVRFQRVP